MFVVPQNAICGKEIRANLVRRIPEDEERVLLDWANIVGLGVREDVVDGWVGLA